jgi:hypothetical protein
MHAASPGTAAASLAPPESSDSGVLGATTDLSVPNVPDTSTDYTVVAPLPTLIPLPTLAPIPTSAPVPASAPPLNCAGTANEDKSQVYLSSATSVVGSSVTISVELRDCNNSLASDDNLSVSQQTSDASVKLNGQSGSINIRAVSGKASFTVTSQNAGTVTLVITDTNQHFPVTMPGYHNPSVTYSNNTSGNSHCTTDGGTPNSWYSDVYPNPPVSTTTGSQQMLVVIRDCNQNPVSSDTIKVTVISGDSGAKINGNPSPHTFSVQNGQGNFTVSSNVSGTITLSVQDTTSGFTVTNVSNQNPSVSFSAPAATSASPTPTPTTAAPTPTTAAPTPTGTPASTTSAVLRWNPA